MKKLLVIMEVNELNPYAKSFINQALVSASAYCNGYCSMEVNESTSANELLSMLNYINQSNDENIVSDVEFCCDIEECTTK